ncbi:MAG: four helix bundle protein [Saprospiraceae bacterium]
MKGQLFRLGTSPAANYRAACRAKSGSDWVNKLKIVEKELDKTQLCPSTYYRKINQYQSEKYKNTKSQRWPINRK